MFRIPGLDLFFSAGCFSLVGGCLFVAHVASELVKTPSSCMAVFSYSKINYYRLQLWATVLIEYIKYCMYVKLITDAMQPIEYLYNECLYM